MIHHIAILPPEEAQKIAAGEVVERPANIVKELIENSLDAQATAITLFIKDAGKREIRIVDNGIGMEYEDAKLCFYPHATSKISSLDDLTHATTFGFRGEALASIAAVSKVTLLTTANHTLRNTQPSLFGSKIVYEGGRCILEEQANSPVGTEFCIQDLFFNTPVRKKFLKQDETEWNQIYSVMQAFCLSNISVHFRIYRDDNLILNAPPAKTLHERIIQLWDYALAQAMIPLKTISSEKKQHFFNITGMISNHQIWRYNKQHIITFVNGRLVKDSDISKAVIKGYLNVLPPDKCPAAVLFITIDPLHVDVNVHPKKEEVRFSKPGIIYNSIKETVHETLADQVKTAITVHDIPRPLQELSFSNQNQKTLSHESSDIFAHKSTELANKSLYKHSIKESTNKLPSFEDFLSTDVITNKKPLVNEPINAKIPTTENTPHLKGTYIGQLFATYLLIEHNKSLIIVDQHAAHERVLYEKFSSRFEKTAGTYLLFPQIIHFEPALRSILLNNADIFLHHGITLDPFDQGTIAVKTTPPGLLHNDLADFLHTCGELIVDNEKLETDVLRKKIHEHIHSHLACKTAIKAGDIVTPQQALQLFDDVQKTECPFICIHGRPTMWTITQADLEKNFQRR